MSDLRVQLHELSRSFGAQKVIHQLNYELEPGHTYAILGGNGSGKSTLLQLIQGSLSPSSGSVNYSTGGGKKIERSAAAFRISLSGPYSELIEELSALEFLRFYQRFRPFIAENTAEEILEICYLTEARNKLIANFSSGMKQRLRLGLSLFSRSDLILLDEPTSNLDPAGIAWYGKMITEYRNGRTLAVGSNHQEAEMGFCQHRLELSSLG